MSGTATPNLPLSNGVDDVVGNSGGNTVRVALPRLAALLSYLQGPAYKTSAELFADKAWPDGAIGQVYGDTAGQNGTYRKSGAAGTGSWTRTGDLAVSPLTAAQLADKADLSLVNELISEVRTGRVYAPHAATVSAMTPPAGTDRLLTSAGASVQYWVTANAPADGVATDALQADATGQWWRRVFDGRDLTAEIAARVGAIRDAGVMPLVNVQGKNVITAELTPAMKSGGATIAGASTVELIPVETSDGPVMLNIDGGGNILVKDAGGDDLQVGALVAGRSYFLRRRGATWRIIAGGVTSVEMRAETAARNAAIASEAAAREEEDGKLALAMRDGAILPLTSIAGTGDAITADLQASMVNAGITTLSAIAEVEYTPVATNAAVNPTITIAGVTYGIRDADGGAWPAGGFSTARIYKLRRRGTTLRVVNGAVIPADLAAEAAARTAADTAEAVARAAAFVTLRQTTPTDAGSPLIDYDDGRVALSQRPTGLDFVPSTELVERLVAAGVGGGGGTGEDTELRERLAASPLLDADAGSPLIDYDDGRVAVAQKADGIDFVPSASAVSRIVDNARSRNLLSQSIAAPAGGWDAEVVDGVTQFTAHAGPDLIDRFRLVNGVWRPTPREAVILIGFGQSQAGVYVSKNEPLPWGTTPPLPHHILMLNDVWTSIGGLRGWVGGTPSVEATALVPAQYHALQDIATAVGVTLAYLEKVPPVVVCRTEGRPGHRLIGPGVTDGIYKGSDGNFAKAFVNLHTSAQKMVDLAVSEGYVVKEVVVLFDHGEADGNAGVSEADYTSQFAAMRADLASRVSRPVRWLVTQPAGGDSGESSKNDWATRQALYSMQSLPDVHPVHAKYDLLIGNSTSGEPDTAHTGYVGRLMLGEMYGHALAEIRAGRGWKVPRMATAAASGNEIVVDYNSDLPIVIGRDELFVIPSRVEGFELVGTAAKVISARRTGIKQLTLTCDSSPTGGKIRNGFASENPANAAVAGQRYPIQNTTVRDLWQRPSRWVPGQTLRRWAWGHEIQL